ncbi:MAG: outer membrane beta-barrel protein [Lysobacterales bacterium]
MQRNLTLALIAWAIPTIACAGDSLGVDLDVGSTRQHGAGSNSDVQLTLSYPIWRALGVELTAGRNGASIEEPNTLGLAANLPVLYQSAALDQRIGLGLRYDFAVDQPIQPYLRAGYMQYRGDYQVTFITPFAVDELPMGIQVERFRRSLTDASWYLAAGARYALGGGWDMHAQVQYSPVRSFNWDFAQTSVQLGVGYRY